MEIGVRVYPNTMCVYACICVCVYVYACTYLGSLQSFVHREIFVLLHGDNVEKSIRNMEIAARAVPMEPSLATNCLSKELGLSCANLVLKIRAVVDFFQLRRIQLRTASPKADSHSVLALHVGQANFTNSSIL